MEVSKSLLDACRAELEAVRAEARLLARAAQRQIDILSSGGVVEQQTRGYDSSRGETFLQRTKEDAHDYRYFPEPDLLPLNITDEQINTWSLELPELPSSRQQRYISMGLPDYDAKLETGTQNWVPPEANPQ